MGIPTQEGALAGLKVLDLTRVLAGPWCTQILADLGADVIKVERPGVGDDTRAWGPPFLKDSNGDATDQATYFVACNRNKRSVTLDMATAEGQDLIKLMAATSDVIVENFKTGGLKQYGLDHEALRAANPRLIYCSVTGFGQDGPYAARAGYDLLIQASSGMMSITGRPDDALGGGPLRVGVALTDLFTGVYASTAILAALEVRHRTGAGQHIDMALLDVGMAILANQASAFLNTGVAPQRQGNSNPSLAPYQDFRTEDGSMMLAIGNSGQFTRFCEVAGHPELAVDERFLTNTLRVLNRSELIERIEAITQTRTTGEWVELLESKAVPCGPINDIAQAFEDAQVKARGLVVSLPRHAGDGVEKIVGVACPLRLSTTPPVLRHAPPALGQHTDEVLAELGIPKARVQALRDAQVI
ncbi:CaiB/BaiF CoA-transferase family protein [Achromobacter sp. UMC46]|uniref:CaiB/BaiF CoA transferase family protein n=1 Tax=Achromobacter sp. UMC46 TaxID=1862319 RepID=UPI0015FF0C58|nr:CaiB/BaiF CoA-transferase family protein [Achromobacter sp. UMC46]MBB1597780.1 CoA-transferase [Achromobacter sp. UMC46]